jgi:hypothetical protein
LQYICISPAELTVDMKKTGMVFMALTVQLVSSFAVAQQPVYKNKNLSPEARTKDLLARMNLDEKVMQMQCLWIQKSGIFNDKGDFTIMIGISSDKTESIKLKVTK